MFVIAGASGNTGSVVADALLAREKKVRVLVRDASKGEAWKKKGADVAIASVDDPRALAKAFDGAEAAYVLSPPDVRSNAFIAERKKTLDVIASALDDANVGHVVFLSSVGAQHDGATGPIRTVAYGERRLAQTKAPATFVRAAYFLENWSAVLGAAREGTLPTFLPPDLAIPMVSTRDIGLTAANALLEGPPASKTRIIELAGPREYSSRDIARALATILGKPVKVEGAPLSAVVPTFTSFGISANVAELFREMYAGLANGTIAWQGDGAHFVRGNDEAERVLRALLG